MVHRLFFFFNWLKKFIYGGNINWRWLSFPATSVEVAFGAFFMLENQNLKKKDTFLTNNVAHELSCLV